MSATLQHPTRIMLTLDELSDEILIDCDRSQKYSAIIAHNRYLRATLLHWIERAGLCDQLVEMGEATVFNVIFLSGSNSLATALRRAPGVTGVTLCSEGQLQMLPGVPKYTYENQPALQSTTLPQSTPALQTGDDVENSLAFWLQA